MSEKIGNILDVTMEKLRALVDANTVVGTPIQVGEITLIPVSKISFGLASGGSDLPSKSGQPVFGGGGGAGVSVVPVAFLCVSGTTVRTLPITADSNTIDRAIAAAPELMDKVKETFGKEK